MERIVEEISEDYPSSLSDSDDDSREIPFSDFIDSNVYRLFGRRKTVHQVFGGGKPADILLWRDKRISIGSIAIATAIWVSFEIMEYHFLTLVSYLLILVFAILFFWSNLTKFINKSPPTIPEVNIPEEPLVKFASVLTHEINQAIDIFRETSSGRNLKMFLIIVFGLWATSIVGSWFSFFTLLYILFVLLHAVPVVYEKYDEKFDPFVEKAMIDIRKKYEAFWSKMHRNKKA
ncbi:reticulon-like protein B6 [Impatiens glandulifera]|uniref:reticulon-like protein B6 n=1 Tax=Impatiens glandulifera TaxID=253017 RepID=UPI001FB190D7|nr:reticulon-like protein B6 [Impatiens glandulifera]